MFKESINQLVYFILFSSLLMIVVALFVAYVIHSYKQRQINNLKNLNELKSLHENQLLKAQIQVQEQTFEHISNEIHDNIGQKLSLAKLHLNSIDTIENLYHKELLTDSIKIITESLNDLRDLSRSMSFDFISNNGFIKAIENDINQMNKSGQYNIKLTITGDPVFLEAQLEVVLYRITQEVLSNIIKHADATKVNIQLHYTANELNLEITDNGCGFDINTNEKGNGLNNIQKRAQSLNGEAFITSKSGTGTTITIKIPIYDRKTV